MTESASSLISVIIPAYQEAERITGTVSAARALPNVTRVLVIDDGSTDGTAALAEAAGAEVLRLEKNGGKGAALRAGLAACPGAPDDLLLLLDADLGASAAEAAKLLEPLQRGEADMAIAQFPKPPGKSGFGMVKGLARIGCWVLTRRLLHSPLSGQRACRRWVLAAAPLADGYGLEVAMNVAAGDAGARLVEIPVEMTHAHTGRTLAGFRHRGRQFLHILAALLAAAFGRTGEPLVRRVNPWRVLVWLAAVIAYFWLADSYNYEENRWRFIGYNFLSALSGLIIAAIFSILLGARRKNYHGRFLPSIGGLFMLTCIMPEIILNIKWLPDHFKFMPPHFYYINGISPVITVVALLAWLLLGLWDDLHGNTERKGFRGHLRALSAGRLTTGGLKLLGGGLLALVMALTTLPSPSIDWVFRLPLAGVCIALSANALNLFDLRPGRALKVWWLIMVTTILLDPNIVQKFDNGPIVPILLDGLQRPETDFYLLLLLLFCTLIYAPLDFAGMMMLGDTGANPLGAVLGLCLVLALPVWGQLIAVLLLIALHIYAERASITRLIERVGWLRWLDNWGRSDMPTDVYSIVNGKTQ